MQKWNLMMTNQMDKLERMFLTILGWCLSIGAVVFLVPSTRYIHPGMRQGRTNGRQEERLVSQWTT